MKAQDFCYWLQGYFELSQTATCTPEQIEVMKTHLALVFKHDPACAHDKPKQVFIPTVFPQVKPSDAGLREHMERAMQQQRRADHPNHPLDGQVYC